MMSEPFNTAQRAVQYEVLHTSTLYETTKGTNMLTIYEAQNYTDDCEGGYSDHYGFFLDKTQAYKTLRVKRREYTNRALVNFYEGRKGEICCPVKNEYVKGKSGKWVQKYEWVQTVALPFKGPLSVKGYLKAWWYNDTSFFVTPHEVN